MRQGTAPGRKLSSRALWQNAQAAWPGPSCYISRYATGHAVLFHSSKYTSPTGDMEFLLQLVCPRSETEGSHTIGQLRGLLPTWLQSGSPRRHTDERWVLRSNGCWSLEGGHPSKSKVLLPLLIYSTGQGKSLCIAQLQGQEVSLKATESLCPGTAFSWPPTRLARVPELCSEQALLFPNRHPRTSVPAPRPLSILWEDGLRSDPKPVLDHFSLFHAPQRGSGGGDR